MLTVDSPRADGPRYVRGHGVTLAMVALGTCMYGFMMWWYARANGRRERGEMREEHRLMSEEELMELGDDSPCFRYTA